MLMAPLHDARDEFEKQCILRARSPRSRACRARRRCWASSAATCIARCGRSASCPRGGLRKKKVLTSADGRSPAHHPRGATPALVLDRAALERNIARLAQFFSIGSCRVRPHFKAHKTPEIARRQIAAGSCIGLTCATVGEAETVAEFCDDVLIANEVVSAAKCARIAALQTGSRVVAVDSVAGSNAGRGGAACRHAHRRPRRCQRGAGLCGVAPGATRCSWLVASC